MWVTTAALAPERTLCHVSGASWQPGQHAEPRGLQAGGLKGGLVQQLGHLARLGEEVGRGGAAAGERVGGRWKRSEGTRASGA